MEEPILKEVDGLKKRIHELQIENERLNSICHIGWVLTRERDLDDLLPLVLAKITKALNVNRSTLFLVDWEHMELWTKFSEGLKGDDKIKIELKMGLIGLAVLTKQLVNRSNAYEDPRFNSAIDGITGYRTESLLAAPFFDKKGDVLGALELLNKKTGVFTKEDEAKVTKALPAFSKLDYSTETGRESAKALTHKLRQSTACERSSLFLLDEEKGKVSALIADGLEDQDLHLSLNLGIAGHVLITGQDLTIQDVYADPRFDKTYDEKTGFRTSSILAVPIKDQSGDIIGVIEAINKKDGDFNDFDMDMLKALSSIVAISVENATLFREQDKQFKSILEVMAASIDAKDSLTAGHSERMAKFAIGIAHELGFEKPEIDVLGVAALLHDYGKVGTDENILKKPGKLTPEEFDHIKQHVVTTRNILDKMYFMRKYSEVPLIAACHHERLDGSGYCEGLKSPMIPFMAKIIAVADVFEALTAERHYRGALSVEKAFEILEEDIGSKLDENIVMALKRHWNKTSLHSIEETLS